MKVLSEAPQIENLTPEMPTKSSVTRKRLYAFLTDLYAIVFLNKFVSIVWMTFINQFFVNTLSSKVSSEIYSGTSKLSLGIIYLGYFTFFYYLNEGRSLGKIFFKLKVCSNHNHHRPLTFMEAFSRSMGYLFCNLLWFTPFATIFFRRDAKSICDYISQTNVLSDEEMAIIENLEEKSSNTQIDLFKEDPVSLRIRKIS